MSYSILSSVKDNVCHADKVIFRSMFKHALPGKLYEENCRSSFYGFQMLFTIVITSWIGVMLLLAGDIHPNPGPSTVSSVSLIYHQLHLQLLIFRIYRIIYLLSTIMSKVLFQR